MGANNSKCTHKFGNLEKKSIKSIHKKCAKCTNIHYINTSLCYLHGIQYHQDIREHYQYQLNSIYNKIVNNRNYKIKDKLKSI